MRQVWGATGTAPAYERTFQRTQLGADPGVVAESLRKYWDGASGAGDKTPLPVPSTIPLPQAQEYLKSLSTEMKARLDAKLQTLPPEALQRSHFWRMYQQYPEQAATLMARRLWTNQMVGKGPVADWMKWLG